MTWFKIDDSMWSHPKVMLCSDAAIALWARAGSFSCDKLTDGFIHRAYLPSLRATEKAAAELVAAGLWEPVDDGWRFHDWADYNETGDEVEAKKAAARERMRRVRANNKRTKQERSPSVRANEARTEPESGGMFAERSQVVPGVPSPVKTKTSPVRPVPDRESNDRTDERAPEKVIEAALVGIGITDPARVVGAIAKACGRIPDSTAVVRIVATILDRASKPVRSPMGVVLKAIANDWPEWQQMIDEADAA